MTLCCWATNKEKKSKKNGSIFAQTKGNGENETPGQATDSLMNTFILPLFPYVK